MSFVRVKVGRPVFRRGGGSLKATITAAGSVAAADVRAAVVAACARVVDATVSKAGPGVNRDGWPIGPPRPWEPGHVHSYTRFQVIDRSRGWYIRVEIVNPADYAQFIHEPGNKAAIVWKREIRGPLDAEIKALRTFVPKAIRDRLAGR